MPLSLSLFANLVLHSNTVFEAHRLMQVYHISCNALSHAHTHTCTFSMVIYVYTNTDLTAWEQREPATSSSHAVTNFYVEF